MTYVAIETPIRPLNTNPTVTVTAVSERREDLTGTVLEVHYRADTRAPRVGERVATWRDVSTSYAMAPRR